MTTVLVLGDTHGNINWCNRVVRYASRKGITRILQVGDFGYWPHMDDGYEFLEELSASLIHSGAHWYWVDGNHENFDALEAIGAFNAETSTMLHPYITYLPRGYAWRWDGRKFLALGGAASIDKESRVEGHSWWAQETIRYSEAERAAGATDVDVMVTHDAPKGVETMDRYKADHAPSEANRTLLRDVVDIVKPTMLFHGHYHERRSSQLQTVDGYMVQVEGLGRDGMCGKAGVLLDLATLTVTDAWDL